MESELIPFYSADRVKSTVVCPYERGSYLGCAAVRWRTFVVRISFAHHSQEAMPHINS